MTEKAGEYLGKRMNSPPGKYLMVQTNNGISSGRQRQGLKPVEPLWTARRLSPQAIAVDLCMHSREAAWFLLSSDRHHDNPGALHDLELRHLRQVAQHGGGIIDIGDLFCAMQGKWDPRKDYDQLRPELAGNDYLDRLLEYNASFYAQFARYFVQISPGNHETQMLKRHDTDLTRRLSKALGGVEVGPYAGWIKFNCSLYGDGKHGVIWYYYHHGPDKGGPVTRGVISTNRMAVYLVDADVVHTGHSHDQWIVPIARTKITPAGIPYVTRQWHVRTPGYKEEWLSGQGWHVETGKPPKLCGAAWLKIWPERTAGNGTDRVQWCYEVTNAE